MTRQCAMNSMRQQRRENEDIKDKTMGQDCGLRSGLRPSILETVPDT